MILDIEQKEHELTCSYFNKEGIVEYVRVPILPEDRFNWEYCANDDKQKDQVFTSWDLKPVKKVKLSKSDDYTRSRLSKYRVEELLLKYPDITKPLTEFNTPRKYFIDIEVEVIDGFPDADTAQNKVTAISIVGSDSKTVQVLALNPLTEKQCTEIEEDINSHFGKFKDKWTFRYKQFESEYALLQEFFYKLLPKFPCISGWNFAGYDWKYLINRCAKLKKIDPSIKLDPSVCSPSGKLQGKNKFPQHRLIVDYLEIYKKWDRVIKIRENDKLDYVGKMAVGIEKIKYPGTLKELYEKDFQKFIFYNAVDSVLVHYIDKKLNTMLTYLKLGDIAGVEAKKTFSPIWIMETLMCKEFLKRNQVFIYDQNKDNDEQKAFDGAYVKDVMVGFHNWITCYDFASLYPTILRQFNISPESFIGNNLEPSEGQIKVGEHQNEVTKELTWRVFDNSRDSILRIIITSMYAKRKETKQKYLTVNKEIDILEKRLNHSLN